MERFTGRQEFKEQKVLRTGVINYGCIETIKNNTLQLINRLQKKKNNNTGVELKRVTAVKS